MRTVMLMLGASATLAMATPLQAQEGTATADVSAGEAETNYAGPDPERLAAAGRLIDRIWPVGTYRRIMESTMSVGAEAAEASIETMTWATSENGKLARRAQHEARTGRPLRRAPDEEQAIASVAEGMANITATLLTAIDQAEPAVRAALTRIYARRYNLNELNELDAFFATPTGRRYAEDSITLMNDPEMVAATTSMVEGTLADVLPGQAEAASEAAAAATNHAASKF
ncbi:DUF2059 domain-containing protein [Sphingomonas lacunae]|uniref:DUF2059 domain-containing protein n=1 Tax=Sphingomonas lacunae TaxID=2698828 RepID=A0A6M4AQ74_9SPHN|nr:DUF2059 domain-containing protein [Sphingomonas lacunae]QJQ31175.1 DUF2059 domain-containing protein [Sphingomonas lacunae]